jgi:C-terminal processing protease CtpA/Prc
MTPEAATYLDEALDFIQRHAIMNDRVDWPALRRDVLELARDARTTADTYPAIRLALSRLGDRHSHLVEPEVVRRNREAGVTGLGLMAAFPEGVVVHVAPGSPAARAGLRVGDLIATVDGVPAASLGRDASYALLHARSVVLALRTPGDADPQPIALQDAGYSTRLLPEGRRLAQDIGYLELPPHVVVDGPHTVMRGQEYAATAHRIIRDIDQTPTRGWVVDLRRNPGGDMWPMLVGVGPILGEGECCQFVSPEATSRIAYVRGRVLNDGQVEAEVDAPYQPERAYPPVAVLTSRFTGSAGEFVTLAFRGRPAARSFGEATAGVPTGNMTKVLPDGGLLLLTVCLGADRSGRTDDGSIEPDVPVEPDWTQWGLERDPVLQVALRWLDQPQVDGGG